MVYNEQWFENLNIEQEKTGNTSSDSRLCHTVQQKVRLHKSIDILSSAFKNPKALAQI